MPIAPSRFAKVLKSNRDLFLLAQNKLHTLVLDHAIPRCARQRVSQSLGGGQDVIKRPEFAQIHPLREMDSEKIVLQGTRNLVEKLDLVFNGNPRIGVFKLNGG